MELTAISGGTLIDGTGRPPIPDSVVLVDGDRILNVHRRREISIPDGAREIDARGKWIIPGLVDCHTHVGVLVDNSFLQVEDPEGLADQFLRTYTGHGVTTVRDTGNFDPEAVFRLLKEGRPEWPRFFGAGVILDGPADSPAPWRWLAVVDDPEEARQEARRLIETGLDFLKIYVWMKPEPFRAIVEEAHRHGVAVAAHVGNVLTVEEAVHLGADAMEHVRVGRELVPTERLDELEQAEGRVMDALASFAPWRFIDPRGQAADELIELLAERRVFWTPTLTLSQSVLRGDEPEITEPPGIEDLPAAVREQWAQYAYPGDYSEEDFEAAKVELAGQYAFVGRAQEGGVAITAGTDVTNPFIVPGHSLHEELRLFVEECGFSHLEALRAATGLAAELLGKAQDLGTVERRKLADLVILDADPLIDISNTRQISAVVRDGEVVSGAL